MTGHTQQSRTLTRLKAIEDIPETWNAVPISALFKRRRETGYSDLQPLSVFRDYGVILRGEGEDNYNRLGSNLDEYQKVEKGDLVLNKMKTWQGSLGVSQHKGIVSPAYIVCKPQHSEHNRYIHYLLRSKPYILEYARRSYGVRVGQWDLRLQDFRRIPCLLPPIEQQVAIADYLDYKTTQIDDLINKKERLIELMEERRTALITRAVTKGLDPDVPMKDSGVEWLGEIPADWNVTKLKMTAEIQTGLTIGQNYNGPMEERPYLRVANVQDGYLDLSEITTVDVPKSEIKKTELQSGDVLMTEGGDFDKLGRGYVWKGQIEGCLHQNHIFAIRPSEDYLRPRFLSYVTTSRYGRTYFSATAKQSTNLASTNRTKVGNFPLPLPPWEEQAQIVAALRERESAIEQLKDLIQEAISILQEYRSALTTAAVTGRIDVRDRVA